MTQPIATIKPGNVFIIGEHEDYPEITYSDIYMVIKPLITDNNHIHAVNLDSGIEFKFELLQGVSDADAYMELWN